MKTIKFAVTTVIACAAFPQLASAQSCTPYQVGGFILGQVAPVNDPGELSCADYDSNRNCTVRRHEFTKNGFEYEVLLTADTFQVIDVTGENDELTGNADDFDYFANLMTQKYNTPDSRGEFHTYYRPEIPNEFRMVRRYRKEKAGEYWINHVCWGVCPSKVISIDKVRKEQHAINKKHYYYSKDYAQGNVLSEDKGNELYLDMKRSEAQQTLIIRAQCPELAGKIQSQKKPNKRTGEF